MSPTTEEPTLYAPITATGRAAVVVVRLSGPRAFATTKKLSGPLPPPRQLRRRRLSDPVEGGAIDDALVVVFPAPGSFTGEDVVELHLHGGAVPLTRLLRALAREPGLAPAGPGAFTRRAFQHGRLDLAQAEAIADLIDAETEAQARLAERQRDHGLSMDARRWRRDLMVARAELEAGLDFADEGDVADRSDRGAAGLAPLLAALRSAVADRRAERLRAGLRVALVGPPNAGKSSLLNALAGRPVAIVHERPGTTRDVLEVALDLAGLPVTLLDTAGLRLTDDPIEAEGVRRAAAAAARADLRLWLVDGAAWPSAPVPAVDLQPLDLVVLTKSDLGPSPPFCFGGRAMVPVSVTAAAGLDGLLAALQARAGDLMTVPADAALVTRAWHRLALEEAADRIAAACGQPDAVLAAEDLRAADAALARITGEQGVESLLDRIFATFCIGK